MKIKQLLPAFIIIVLVSTTFMLNNPTPTVNITGIWTDSNSVAFQNCYVIFSQNGDKITMLHYLEFKGKPMVEEGKGKVTGNIVNYDVVVTKAIPGWATTGKHSLTLSADGTTLRGTYADGIGKTGPLIFKKLR